MYAIRSYYGNGGVEGDLFGGEFGLGFLEEGLAGADLGDTGNHGEHHPYPSLGRGAEDGPQLQLEQPPLLERKAHGPQPHSYNFV